MSQYTAARMTERPGSDSDSGDIVSQSDIEKLLAQVGSHALDGGGDPSALSNAVRRHEFPRHSLFSSALRPLRVRHEDFINALAARLSIHLGLEVTLQMSKLEAMPFQQFVDGLASPTYLTLLKLQPLAGVCLIDMSPKLGLSIVDRELGGPGRASDETRPIGKIETRLLAPFVSLIANEWCAIWKDFMEIRPTVLGNESNSRDLHSSSPAASMLVVRVQVTIADAADQMQLAFPHSMIEPLLLKLNAEASSEKANAVPALVRPKWNPLFDTIQVELKAELPELEIIAGQLAGLKTGDILQLPPDWMNQVQLRLAGQPGFIGILGISNKQRAVKIAQLLKD